MATGKLRHAWLRDALMDRGKRQKDLAALWKVDEAVASRFIRTGEPELTMARAESLAKFLGMDLLELQARLAERPVPRVHERLPIADIAPGGVLEELHRCVARARAALPGWKIQLTIEPANNEV